MQPQNERIALATAATLLKQVRRVLRHAGDPQAAFVKQSLDRLFPIFHEGIEAPEPDDASFFGALEQVHGAEFADEARDGEKPPGPAASSSAGGEAESLRKELAAMKAELAELKRPPA
jgi:hypothetical protein